MRRISIVPGARFRLEGQTYELKTRYENPAGVEWWEALIEETGRHADVSRAKLLDVIEHEGRTAPRKAAWQPKRSTLSQSARAIAAGEVEVPVGARDAVVGADTEDNGVFVVGDEDELHGTARDRRAAQTIRFKRLLVATVGAQTSPGWLREKDSGGYAATLVRRACEDVSRQVFGRDGKVKTISLRQYLRYAKEVAAAETAEDLHDRMSNRGSRGALGPGAREIVLQAMQEKLVETEKARARGEKVRLTIGQVRDHVVAAVRDAQSRNPDAGIRVLGTTTFYKYWNQFPSSRRQAALLGPLRVAHDHRRPTVPDHATYPLEVCQFDETKLRLLVRHQEYNVILGKPTLAWVADTFSGGICGFFLGFDPPSDLVTGQTLRHACVPKTYVGKVYPEIHNPWLHGGVPTTLLFDNSLTARSKSVARITNELDILHDFQPSRMPWLKHLVENTFGVVEKALLSQLGGFTPDPAIGMSKVDYDPRRDAIIDLDRLVAILHAWICDQYHTRRPTTGQELPPNVLWEQGREIVEPTFLASDVDLNALFGKTCRARRLDSRGFRYQDIYYYSEDVDLKRSRDGAVDHIDIRVNPLDLGTAYFRGSDNRWYPARFRDQHARGTRSLDGMTEHLWKILGNHASELYGVRTLEERFNAGESVRAMVAASMNDKMRLRTGERLGRALGISSAAMFSRIDAAGEIEPPVHHGPSNDTVPKTAVSKDARKPRATLPVEVVPELAFDFSLEDQ